MRSKAGLLASASLAVDGRSSPAKMLFNTAWPQRFGDRQGAELIASMISPRWRHRLTIKTLWALIYELTFSH
jgi:hypothetical protein